MIQIHIIQSMWSGVDEEGWQLDMVFEDPVLAGLRVENLQKANPDMRYRITTTWTITD